MKKMTCILLALLTGCGNYQPDESLQSQDNHGYGWEFDVQGESGLKLRYSPWLPGGPLADVTRYERDFAFVESCTGISAPAPFVIIGKIPGFFYEDPSLIVIDEYGLDTRAYTHEIVHYLLKVSTGSPDPEHQSPFFETCVLVFGDNT